MRQLISQTRTLFISPIFHGLWLCLFCLLLGFQPLTAQNNIDSLLNALDTEQSDDKKVNLLFSLSNEYFYSKPQKSIEYCSMADDITQKENFQNDSIKVAVDYCLATGYSILSDTTKAFYHYNKALDLAKKIPYQIMVVDAYEGMGITYSEMKVFDRAMENYKKSREVSIQINDTLRLTNTNNNIALGYLELKQFDQAQYYLEENYNLEKDLEKDNLGFQYFANTLLNLGIVFYNKKELDRSLDYYQKALHIVDSLNIPYMIMKSRSKIADVYKDKKMIEMAENYYHKAYEIAKEIGIKREISHNAFAIAKLEYEQKNYETSIQLSEEALRLIQETGSKEEVADIYQCLANNFEVIGQFKKSIAYHKRFEATRDSFINQERTKIFAELDLRYQSDKKDAENQYLKTVQLKNELVIRERTMIAIAVALGLCSLFFFTVLLHKQNQKKKIYNQVLEQKVSERTEYLISTNERLTNANQELERFAYITSHDLKEPIRSISGFATLIQKDISKKKYNELDTYLQFIIKSSKQMNSLIEDVLSFSKVDKEKSTVKYTSLAEIMARVRSDLNLKIQEKNAQIQYSSASLYQQEKEIKIPFQLSMVFKNFIENGIKYNESPTPSVWIDYREENSKMFFSFKDNGIGISKDYHKTIFEMFKRLHNRSKYDGSGIGLAICKKTILSLQGELFIDSHLGQGSTFEFCIPLDPTQSNEKNKTAPQISIK